MAKKQQFVVLNTPTKHTSSTQDTQKASREHPQSPKSSLGTPIEGQLYNHILGLQSQVDRLEKQLYSACTLLGTENSELTNHVDALIESNKAISHDLTNLFTQVHDLQNYYHTDHIGGLRWTNERVDRLIDHVNREIGVAEEIPLHERLEKVLSFPQGSPESLEATKEFVDALDQSEEKTFQGCVFKNGVCQNKDHYASSPAYDAQGNEPAPPTTPLTTNWPWDETTKSYHAPAEKIDVVAEVRNLVQGAELTAVQGLELVVEILNAVRRPYPEAL